MQRECRKRGYSRLTKRCPRVEEYERDVQEVPPRAGRRLEETRPVCCMGAES